MKRLLLPLLILTAGIQAVEPDSSIHPQTAYSIDLPWNDHLQEVKRICKEAGSQILNIRNSGKLKSTDAVLPNGKIVRQTNADIAASQYILNELAIWAPNYSAISQDQMEKDPDWYKKERVWLINPIDGTKEFEMGNDDFHIQIGLMDQEESVLGVSYYPATETFIWAIKDQGAWWEQDGTKQQLRSVPSSEKIWIFSSSLHILEPYFQKLGWIPDRVDFPTLSSTSRLLKLIKGEASLYCSLGASSRGIEKKGGIWNYGANVVIAKEAGLNISTLSGRPINLREPSGLLIEGVFITNDSIAHPEFLTP